MLVAPPKIECENRGVAFNAVSIAAGGVSNPFASHVFNIFNYSSIDFSLNLSNCGVWDPNRAVSTLSLDQLANSLFLITSGLMKIV